MFDLVVKGDRVVTPYGVQALDIGVRHGRIVMLADEGGLDDQQRTRTIDAHGCIADRWRPNTSVYAQHRRPACRCRPTPAS